MSAITQLMKEKGMSYLEAEKALKTDGRAHCAVSTGSPLVHPFHIALEAAGHRLIRCDDGDVDIFRLDAGYHNGPECELCGESWCHHCGGEIRQCVKANNQGLTSRAKPEDCQ